MEGVLTSPVPVLVRVSCTSGTTACDASVTVPLIEPVVWATAQAAARQASSKYLRILPPKRGVDRGARRTVIVHTRLRIMQPMWRVNGVPGLFCGEVERLPRSTRLP
jgi:hypothetical protein